MTDGGEIACFVAFEGEVWILVHRCLLPPGYVAHVEVDPQKIETFSDTPHRAAEIAIMKWRARREP